MSDVKHTALPWQANYQGDPVQVGSPGRFVAMTLGCDDSIATGEDYANAKYIATACNAYPALVEALERIASGHYDVTGDEQIARAALAQVQGDE